MCEKSLKWIKKTELDNEYLPNILSFAASNYGHHTEWFLIHRNTGLRNLAFILTAEFTVLGLYFSKTGFPKFLVYLSMILLCLYSILIAISACQSCKKSFKASLESALLVTKTAYAMDIINKVSSKQSSTLEPPVPDDSFLYVNRYYKEAIPPKSRTTEEFVQYNIKKKTTTLFWGNLTIIVFCIGTITTSVIGVFAAGCVVK